MTGSITMGLLLAYVLLVPLVPQLRFGSVSAGLVDVLLALALVGIAVRRRLRYSAPLIALLALAGIVLVSTLWVSPEHRTSVLLRAIRFVAIVAPSILAASIQPTRDQLIALVRWFVVGAGTSVVVGIVFFLFQVPFGDVQTYRFPGGRLLDRAGGIFADSSAFGHLVATWITVTLVFLPLLFPRRSRALIPMVVLLLGIAGVALFGSLSRSALVGLFASGAAAVLLPRPRVWRRTYGFVVRRLLLVFVLALSASLIARFDDVRSLGMFVSERLGLVSLLAPGSTAEALDELASGRLTNWGAYLGLVLENPLTGIGYKALSLERGVPPDNQYLSLLVETGVLGLGTYLVFAGALVWTAMTMYVRGNALGWALLVIWAGQFAIGLTIDTLTFWGAMPPILIITFASMNAGRRFETRRPSASMDHARGAT